MFLPGNKAYCLSSVNPSTKTIHHYHHYIRKIPDFDIVFGHVDVFELVRKKPPYERNQEAFARRWGELDFAVSGMLITLNGVTDLRDRCVVVLECIHQEAGSILFDPIVHAGDDLAVTEVRSREFKDLIGQCGR